MGLKLNNISHLLKFKRQFHSSLFLRTQSQNVITTNFSPARSILYVPGNDTKKLSKIFQTNADCVVMDCEDGVAFNRKQEAREKIRQLYDNDERLANDSEAKYAVRINSPSSNLASDDINALFTVKNDAQNKASLLPKRVFIPKTSNSEEIKWLFDKFHSVLKSYNNFKSINMFFYMETALSLINLNDIIKTAIHLSNEKYTKKFLLEGFVFGSDDYTADIAAIRTKEANELVYARQKLVAFCKAYKLKVIDMVYIDFKDLEGLKKQSEEGARMGFTGKQVIHPNQVDIAQDAFTPSKEKIEWALGLIHSFEEHQKQGAGAFTYKGQMIDMPSLLQAKNIISIAKKANRI